jgi:hypothetical protein
MLDFRLPVSSGKVPDGAIENFTPENIALDSGIMFLSRRIAELPGVGIIATPLDPSRGSRYELRSAVRGLHICTKVKAVVVSVIKRD